jgi:hypothetical protein
MCNLLEIEQRKKEIKNNTKVTGKMKAKKVKGKKKYNGKRKNK